MTQETSGFMERQLLERMIGAGVLLVALVIIVPAILDGRPDIENTPQSSSVDQESSESAAPSRTHTIRLDRPAESPPVARRAAVPEPSPRVTAPESTPPAATELTPAKPATTVKPASEPKPQPAPTHQEVAVQKPAAVVSTPKPAPAPKLLASKTPVSSARAGWIVQLGAFSQEANAQRQVDDARAKGFPAYLMALERTGKALYRVRIGPRDTRESANELATSLAKAGYKGQVVEQKPDDR